MVRRCLRRPARRVQTDSASVFARPLCLSSQRIDRTNLLAGLPCLTVAAVKPLGPRHLTNTRVGCSEESIAAGGGEFARNRQVQNELVTAPRLLPFAQHLFE